MKPFNPLELTGQSEVAASQIHAVKPHQSNVSSSAKNEISIKGLIINKDNHKVIVYGEEIKLTPIEFDILYLRLPIPGVCSARMRFPEKVWK